jgi:hypothetical protein
MNSESAHSTEGDDMKELVWFDGMNFDLLLKTPIEELYTLGSIGDWNTLEGNIPSNVNPLLLFKDTETNLSLWMTVERDSFGHYFFPIDLILHDPQNESDFRVLHTIKYSESLQTSTVALSEPIFTDYLHYIFKNEVLVFQDELLSMKTADLVHFLDEANQLLSPGSFPKTKALLFDEYLQNKALLAGVDGTVDLISRLTATLEQLHELSASSYRLSSQSSSLAMEGLSLKAIYDCHLIQKRIDARVFEETMAR